MFIQPDTEIRLIKGCPLDPSYENTIYFTDSSEQVAYFKSLSGVSFTKQYYQRYAKGVISVEAKLGDIFNCNYLMFKNTGFENKWFYAFVTKVEYVNNITCRIYYTLDVMQTWMCDAIIKPCFVEREHSKTDNIGENLVHEDIYFGPYTYDTQTVPVSGELTMQDLSVVVMFNPSWLSDISVNTLEYKSNFYCGTYQGVSFLVFRATPENVGLIDNLFDSIDFVTFGGFVGAFMMPTMFLPNASTFNEYNKHVSFSLTRNNDFDGYEPKNKKLLTYPYTCANLTSNRNEGNDFAFEHFTHGNDGKATFSATGNLCANPSSMAFPTNYKHIAQFIQGAVTIPSYPVCTWGADGVTEWINNNLFKSMATVGATMLMGMSPASAVTGAAINGGIPGQMQLPAPSVGLATRSNVGLSNNFTHTNPTYSGDFPINFGALYGQASALVADALSTPLGYLSAIGAARSEFDSGCVHGDASGDVLIGTVGGRNITARIKRITRQYAEIVDGYFSRFGYATMCVKEPNRTGRPYWNYVKTRGCAITGAVPAEDARAICAIYDRGITFWNKDVEIGNFEQDNSV